MRLIAVFALFIPAFVFSQPCTTTNASGCGCPDGADTCFLLPDLTISWEALATDGPTEYSQTGNGANDGRLRITGATPNIGWGPFTVKGTDYYICGTDTIYDPSGNPTCPNGATPTNMLHQRIYKKMGATMGYEDHLTGGQTYHPTHGHNHVDDWVTFTLRVEDPNEPDTLKWPIVGTGAKLGFCLMDYGSCNSYNGYCRENQKYGSGVIKNSTNTPNYGLGGGQYSCSPVEQGISVGYLDIYDQSLDGMWINIPPNTCNGNYWIVGEVDPRNTFVESNENNNWTAVPVTLTKQVSSPVASITINGNSPICSGDSVMLLASYAQSYTWSTGETTQSISVKNAGDYFVETIAQCGADVSDTVSITQIASAITSFAEDTTCVSGSVSLIADGTGEVRWYDLAAGGTQLAAGDTFTTPVLTANATYYAENYTELPGNIAFSEPHDHNGSSQFSTFHGYIIFDCHSPFTLKSVKVYTDDAGVRLIEWRNSSGTVLADTSIFIPAGTSRVTLNFYITPGADYQLGTNEGVNNANFGGITPLLRRSSSGVNYPYEVPGILSLKGSPYDSQFAKYYYYFYDWEVQTGGGSCTSPRQPVTAFIAPAPMVTLSGLDTVYQISDPSVTLTGMPSGGSFSGNGVSGNTFTPALAGIGFHTVIYSYEDSIGCYNEYSMVVHVKKGQIIASAGPDAEICEGESATLTASGGTIYEWSTGDTVESIHVSPSVTTIYSVTVSDNFGSSDVADVTVTVNALPIVEIIGLDTLYQVSHSPVTLAGIPAGGTFSGTGVQGDTFYPMTAGVGGPYTITYTYADSAGCANTYSQQVTVILSVGIPLTNNPYSKISVYPNPASDLVIIDCPMAEPANVEIHLYNSIGVMMMSENFLATKDQHSGKIDLSSLATGIYFLEAVTAKTSSVTRVMKK